MSREAAQRAVALLVEAYEAATPLIADIDRLRARAEAAEAERDRLRALMDEMPEINARFNRRAAQIADETYQKTRSALSEGGKTDE